MTMYAVRVKYETISGMYQDETFHFEDKIEASKFCYKAMQQGWNVSAPRKVFQEMFTCDTAMGWVLDEIEACKKAVGA